MPHLNNKWPSVALLAICEVFALALWFSATAVILAMARLRAHPEAVRLADENR